jgi:hypothetical protein
MVHMFTRQTMLISSIVEVLKSRNFFEPDDIEAFEALVRQRENENQEIFHAVVNQYTVFAQGLGLGDDLPQVGKT